jgi:hypothetical protein
MKGLLYLPPLLLIFLLYTPITVSAGWLIKDNEKEIETTYIRASGIAARASVCKRTDIYQFTLMSLTNYAENEDIKQRFGQPKIESYMKLFLQTMENQEVILKKTMLSKTKSKEIICDLTRFFNTEIVESCITSDSCMY